MKTNKNFPIFFVIMGFVISGILLYLPYSSATSYVDYGLLEPGCAPTSATCTVAPPALSTSLGQASGIATLGSDGKLSSSQTPTAPVQSVNGATGTVVLGISDLSAATADLTLGSYNFASGGLNIQAPYSQFKLIDDGATANTGSIIGGNKGNTIGTGSEASYVFGGRFANVNSVGTGSYLSTIAGGYDHTIGNDSFASTISGGGHNHALYDTSHSAGSTHVVIAGGSNNNVTGNYGTISGGTENTITSNNVIASNYVTIGGGHSNTASAIGSTISGGQTNAASGTGSTVSGGYSNTAAGEYSTISGGQSGTANGDGSVVIGGSTNTILPAIASGQGDYSTIIGGYQNTFTATASQKRFSSILGGRTNTVEAGQYSIILGGLSNYINGSYALVAGRRAQATAQGAFAIADSTDADFTNSTQDSFAARFSGGYNLTGGTATVAGLKLSTLPPIYANNAAAVAGGLVAGQIYRSGADPDVLSIVH